MHTAPAIAVPLLLAQHRPALDTTSPPTTATRRFTAALPQTNLGSTASSDDWFPVGDASVIGAIGEGGNLDTRYIRARCGGDQFELHTSRLILADPDVRIPLFSTGHTLAYSFDGRCDNNSINAVLGAGGAAPPQARVWNANGGDGWGDGVPSTEVGSLGTVDSTASIGGFNLTSYLGGHAGLLNGGWQLGIAVYASDGLLEMQDGECRLTNVLEHATWGTPEAPGAFAAVGPADEAEDVSRTPTLEWAASARAVRYRVVMSLNADLSSPFRDVDTDAITVESDTALAEYTPATLPAGTTVYWTVRAVNYAGPNDTYRQETPVTDGIMSFTTRAAAAAGGGVVSRMLPLLIAAGEVGS